MAATVIVQGTGFEVGAVRPLFETHQSLVRAPYDVSANGQRFLISVALDQPVSAPITLVVNWAAGMKK